MMTSDELAAVWLIVGIPILVVIALHLFGAIMGALITGGMS